MGAGMEIGGTVSGQQLVALARARLAYELGGLPAHDAATIAGLLRRDALSLSHGAVVSLMRRTMREHDLQTSHEIFAHLVARLQRHMVRWAWRTASDVASGGVRETIREDLLQELTLALWEQLCRRSGEAWELFFSRSLHYLQQHVAADYLRREGLRPDSRSTTPRRGNAALLAEIGRQGREDDSAPAEIFVEPSNPFAAAELADLRAHVAALPAHERLAVVMRYWHHASEGDIAAALGHTPRNVRNVLRRAYALLNARYTGGEGTP